MNYVFKGNDRVFHSYNVFCQLSEHLKDLRYVFQLGCFFGGDEWHGFEISEFTVDL